jgi:phosphotransferase system  glucose/maltose/N-acetylglucosamine-specific IIC component
MPYLFWHIFQRLLAGLLIFPLLAAFSDCRSLKEIWHVFEAMNHVVQVGIVAIAVTLIFIALEVLFIIWQWWRSLASASSTIVVEAPKAGKPQLVRGNLHGSVNPPRRDVSRSGAKTAKPSRKTRKQEIGG